MSLHNINVNELFGRRTVKPEHALAASGAAPGESVSVHPRIFVASFSYILTEPVPCTFVSVN